MVTRPLRREQDTTGDENCDDQSRADAVEVESAMRGWLGEQVSEVRAKWTGENER